MYTQNVQRKMDGQGVEQIEILKRGPIYTSITIQSRQNSLSSSTALYCSIFPFLFLVCSLCYEMVLVFGKLCISIHKVVWTMEQA